MSNNGLVGSFWRFWAEISPTLGVQVRFGVIANRIAAATVT